MNKRSLIDMEKIELSIIKIRNEYRAIIQLEDKLDLSNKEIVYQSSKKIENNLREIRKASDELKEKAKKWADKHKIPYIINIDFDTYLLK